MVKCSKDQVERLRKGLKREKDPTVRQRIQMVLLREDGMTQPKIAELTGMSLSTVNRAHMAYDNGGGKPLPSKPTGGRRGAKMNLEEEKVPASINIAMPVGLLVNELLTNAFKYAFSGRERGTITVQCLREHQDRYRVVVADDGIGLAEDATWPVQGKLAALILQTL